MPAGYDVTGNPGRLFEREEDEERAELVVSAQVTDVKMNVCRKMGWWLIKSDIIGEEVEASVKVDWTVYSRLERRMVLRTSTRGLYGGRVGDRGRQDPGGRAGHGGRHRQSGGRPGLPRRRLRRAGRRSVGAGA